MFIINNIGSRLLNTNEQNSDVNELIKRRFEELDELKEKGFECYAYNYDVTAYSGEIKSDYDNYESTGYTKYEKGVKYYSNRMWEPRLSLSYKTGVYSSLNFRI